MTEVARGFLAGLSEDPVESTEPLQLRTAVVTEVDKTGTAPGSWFATIRLPDGTVFPGVRCLGWWNLTVNAVVDVLQQGSRLRVLGPLAPAELVAAAAAPPAPAPPPPPPSPPPVVRTVTITAQDSGTWDAQNARWREDGVYQGGGWVQRGLWFYGTQIADAKGAGTITAGQVYVHRKNTSHGAGGQGNVRLGTHGLTGQPAGDPGALGAVASVGTLGRGEAKELLLVQPMLDQLNAGARGVGLEPGVIGYSSVDYVVAHARADGAQHGQLVLTITG